MIGRKRRRQASSIASTADLAVFTLGFQGEVDHHDRVFFDDPDQQNYTDERDDRKVDAANHQGQQCADTGRRKRREDGDRMNVTFVKDPQHDVDGAERRQDQHRFVRQRVLEGLRGSSEAPVDARRKPDTALGRFDGRDRVAQRNARRKVERKCYGGKLSLMIHRERGNAGLIVSKGTQFDFGVVGRARVDLRQRCGILPVLGRDFHHDVILVQRRIHRRYLALPEGVVQGIVDHLLGQSRGATPFRDRPPGRPAGRCSAGRC